MKVIVNWPLLTLVHTLVICVGAIAYGCFSEQSFAQKKLSSENELAKRLPDILPEGWRATSRPSCITWCREMLGSEFTVDAMTDEGRFSKLSITCTTPDDEHSCGWRRVIIPCEEAL